MTTQPDYSSRAPSPAAAVTLLLLLAGCADDPTLPSALEPAAPQLLQIDAASEIAHDLDAEWANIAQNILPGFAGYYRDHSGEYVVAISDISQSDRARMLVESWLTAAGKTDAILRVRQVGHGFAELKAWKDQATHLVDGTNVYWLDVDEIANKLVFGVESVADASAVWSAARSEGVPENALAVVLASQPVERASLQDYVRPVVGGLQIQFSASGNTYTCTHGFNATQDGVNGFVTNSHCSSTKFGKDNTVQYQNSAGVSAERIGTEYKDPSSGRDSDASYFSYDSGVDRDWGHIARTTYSEVNERGSLTIDATYPRFRITSKGTNSVQVVGELVNKVGRTSGWTQGQITRTCVTLSSLPCQWEAMVWSEHGDSGSPIFQQNGSSEPDASRVSLWGILWGGPIGDWTTSWYSPLSGVENDLGTLNVVCDPNVTTCYPPPHAAIDGFLTIKTEGTYTWDANASHGDGTYTYQWHYQPDGSSTWYSLGTGSSASRYVDGSDYPGFALRLVVSSAGMSDTEEVYVAVLII